MASGFQSLHPDQEMWMPCMGFPEYAVSSSGRVKRVIARDRWHPPRHLKAGLNSRGYPEVTLYRDGVGRKCAVHRLVIEAFIGIIPEDYDSHHRNANRTDNRAVNLTMLPRGRHGAIRSIDNKGERNGQAKLTKRMVETIRQRIAGGERNMDLAVEYGVCRSCISNIKTGKRWQHIGGL